MRDASCAKRVAAVRFDEMAILVRSPHSYFGLLEHALTRAGVPAWFDRGTRRPHPAGRAFLALLACAGESLSAARFAEYLSLGQVPAESASRDRAWVAPPDEAVNRVPMTGEEQVVEDESSAVDAAASDTEQVSGRHAASAVALGEAARRSRRDRTGRRTLASPSRWQSERARAAEA